jgi:hypothetical protein
MPLPATDGQIRSPEHVYEDPDRLLALAVYLYPDADTPDGRRAIQDEAAAELRRMARGAS